MESKMRLDTILKINEITEKYFEHTFNHKLYNKFVMKHKTGCDFFYYIDLNGNCIVSKELNELCRESMDVHKDDIQQIKSNNDYIPLVTHENKTYSMKPVVHIDIRKIKLYTKIRPNAFIISRMFENYQNEIMNHKTPERLISVLEIKVTDAVNKKKKKNRKNRNKNKKNNNDSVDIIDSSVDNIDTIEPIESNTIDNDSVISSIDTNNTATITINTNDTCDITVDTTVESSSVDCNSVITSYDSLLEKESKDSFSHIHKSSFDLFINISFSRYIPTDDKPIITNLLNNLFETNDSFNHYDTIFVTKPLHYDNTIKSHSYHFTGKFKNDKETTDSYHFYITNDSITSITKIVNILDK